MVLVIMAWSSGLASYHFSGSNTLMAALWLVAAVVCLLLAFADYASDKGEE